MGSEMCIRDSSSALCHLTQPSHPAGCPFIRMLSHIANYLMLNCILSYTVSTVQVVHWTKMAAWKNLDFDFGVHKNHPSSKSWLTTPLRWVWTYLRLKWGDKQIYYTTLHSNMLHFRTSYTAFITTSTSLTSTTLHHNSPVGAKVLSKYFLK